MATGVGLQICNVPFFVAVEFHFTVNGAGNGLSQILIN